MRSEGPRANSRVGIRALAGYLAVVALIACGPLPQIGPGAYGGDPPASPNRPAGLPAATEPVLPSGSAASPIDPTFSGPVSEPDLRVVRGPYLQSVTDHSIVVVWRTDEPSDGQVAYGERGSLRSRVVDPAVGVDHAITLKQLAPNTGYSYRIESGGAPISAEYSFRTAPDSAQAQFSFAAIGDTRTQHDVHRAVAARIALLEPDFVLHTGDLVDDGRRPAQWETFFEIEQAFLARAPLFPAIGNHEEDAAQYFDLFHLPGNERWYSFTYGPALFVVLQIDGYARFDPESEQYAWLRRTLESNTQPWMFVAFHIPPFSSLKEEAIEVSIRETLAPLFERHGVDVVLNGHHHDYQRSIVNGVTYIITGGGGAPIYGVTRADAHLVTYKNAYHVVFATVTEDLLTAVGVTPGGEEFDRFSIAATDDEAR